MSGRRTVAEIQASQRYSTAAGMAGAHQQPPIVIPMVPQNKPVEESGFSLIYELLQDQNRALELSSLTYPNGMFIIDLGRRDVIMATLDLLAELSYGTVYGILTRATSPDDILWNNLTPALQEAHNKYKRQLIIAREPERGVQGAGVCIFCGSTELVFTEAQTRSGDESTTIFARCVMCNKPQNRR